MCLAVPGRVLEILDEGGLATARVDFGGVVRRACLACLPETHIGDYVLVHVGFAIAKVDEQAARETLAALAALGEPAVPEGIDEVR